MPEVALKSSKRIMESSKAVGELISVVIPAYNARAHIAQTLASVSSQSYTNIEIIVVDDGSQDGTGNLVKSIKEHDPRIRLIQKPNGGVASARNAGIQHARGELIAPIDSDDLWHPKKLELQYARLMEAGPDVGLVYTGHLLIDDDGRVIRVPMRFPFDEGDVRLALVIGNIVGNASTPLIPRQRIFEVNGYDEGLRAAAAEGCEDFKLYLSLARRYPFAAVASGLVGYRRTDANMSLDIRRMSRSHSLVRKEFRRKLHGVPNVLWRWSEASFYIWLAGCVRGSRHGMWKAGRLVARAMLRDPFIGSNTTLHWMGKRLDRLAYRSPGAPNALMGRDYLSLSLEEISAMDYMQGRLAARRRRCLGLYAGRLPNIETAGVKPWRTWIDIDAASTPVEGHRKSVGFVEERPYP